MNKDFFRFKKHFIFWCTIIFCTYSGIANAQNIPVTLNLQNAKLELVLNAIEKQTKYLFVYDKNVEVQRLISINVKAAPLKDVLNQLFSKTNISFAVEKESIVLSAKERADAKPVNKKIVGIVKDMGGEPIIGATIIVKGQPGVGTVTDVAGSFSLNLPNGAKQLQISYLGMKTQIVDLGGQNAYNVVLEPSNVKMDEVVVTALGIKKEAKSLSYNVQQLSSKDLSKAPDASFVNSLSGKVAGVTINSSSSGAGGSTRVVMRGAKSLTGNNNALFVVDGIPMANISSPQPNGVFDGSGQTGDGLSSINPDDIESVSVLSGPSAAALYGNSAANGVVIITTKQGQKDKLSVNVSSSTMFSRPLILPKFQNTYGKSDPSDAENYYSWGEKLTKPSSYDPADFFQTGVNASNSVSVSTGNERNQTYVSAGSVNSQGIIHNNNYDRYNFSVRNTSSFLNNKMTMDLGYMYSNVKEQNMISQGQYFNPLVPLYLFPAGDDFSKVQIYERYNAERNFQTQFWPYGDQGLSMQNPYWITERNKFINHKERYMTNASLKYEFAKWINLSGRLKMDKNNDRYEKKFSASTNPLFASDYGYYNLRAAENRQIYGEILLNINKYFNDNMFSLSANVGASFEDVETNEDSYGGNLSSVANLFTYGNVAQSTAKISQSGYQKKKQAVFGTAQLGYKSQLYLDLTAREDWVSTIYNKPFFYPTIGLSGIITDIFNCSTDIMPYMKVRVSYSEVGNEPGLFLMNPTYALTNGYPLKRRRRDNTNLSPERTKSWEGGLNFVFFQNKLKLNATAYTSRTYNQFFQPLLSTSGGDETIIANGGRVDNKGIEVSATYSQDFGKLNWNSTFTYSLNRNKIKSLKLDYIDPATGKSPVLDGYLIGGTSSMMMKLMEGGSMGDIYVNKLRTDEHGAIYVHPSDYEVVAETNNWVYAGSSSPKYNMAWNNNLTWNNISLGFLFSARVGGIVISETQAMMDAFGSSKASADARDAGGVRVNGKLIPATNYYKTVSGVGSMYCYSATNVRLSELNLGYDVPINRWCKFVKALNVSFVGKNLFLLYKKAPFDPELTANTGTYYQGVDYFMMPSLRNLGFSVKLQF